MKVQTGARTNERTNKRKSDITNVIVWKKTTKYVEKVQRKSAETANSAISPAFSFRPEKKFHSIPLSSKCRFVAPKSYLSMDYAVKISELKLGSIQRSETLKLFFSYIFPGIDNFCRFCWLSKIFKSFLLQTMKSSWWQKIP